MIRKTLKGLINLKSSTKIRNSYYFKLVGMSMMCSLVNQPDNICTLLIFMEIKCKRG